MVLSLLVRRARCTPSPDSLAVLASCFSRSVRSVTTTTLKARSTGSERIARTRKTMVSDLPEPCVCQIRPPRRSADRAVLLVARHDLDALATRLREQREVPNDVQQVRGAEHASDQQLLT